jgi:hypothetical protein
VSGEAAARPLWSRALIAVLLSLTASCGFGALPDEDRTG